MIAIPEPPPPASPDELERLAAFLAERRRLLVLTGAGCSTESGIPDYRDANGDWKHDRPVMYQDFVRNASARQRYWARSLIGWRRVARAAPNRAHVALARLEEAGLVHHLVTQNVDGLHRRAGSRRLTDLHGTLDNVECLTCGRQSAREEFQERLEARNPDVLGAGARTVRPDGDVDPGDFDYERFDVPACGHCAGVLKPGVVFFGEAVPHDRVASAFARLEEADALLVVGSSLMVLSGYRFARAAASNGKPVAAVNLGRTRADGEISLKITAACGEVLTDMAQRLLRPENGDIPDFQDTMTHLTRASPENQECPHLPSIELDPARTVGFRTAE